MGGAFTRRVHTGCMSSRPLRNERFTMKVSSEERAWLNKIAELRGISASDVLRLFIRAEAKGIADPTAKAA